MLIIQFSDDLIDLRTIQNNSPTITSLATSSVDENAPVETVIYDVEATDPKLDEYYLFTWHWRDSHLLRIDSDDGEIVRVDNFQILKHNLLILLNVTLASDGQLNDAQSVTTYVNNVSL